MTDYSYMAQNVKMSEAQRMHDRKLPDEKVSFLETDEGQKWLQDTAEHLASGGSFKCGRVRIETHCIIDKMRSDECQEWELYCYASCEYALDKTDANYLELQHRESDLKKKAVEIAKDLLAPHADAWAEEQREIMESYND